MPDNNTLTPAEIQALLKGGVLNPKDASTFAKLTPEEKNMAVKILFTDGEGVKGAPLLPPMLAGPISGPLVEGLSYVKNAAGPAVRAAARNPFVQGGLGMAASQFMPAAVKPFMEMMSGIRMMGGGGASEPTPPTSGPSSAPSNLFRGKGVEDILENSNRLKQTMGGGDGPSNLLRGGNLTRPGPDFPAAGGPSTPSGPTPNPLELKPPTVFGRGLSQGEEQGIQDLGSILDRTGRHAPNPDGHGTFTDTLESVRAGQKERPTSSPTQPQPSGSSHGPTQEYWNGKKYDIGASGDAQTAAKVAKGRAMRAYNDKAEFPLGKSAKDYPQSPNRVKKSAQKFQADGRAEADSQGSDAAVAKLRALLRAELDKAQK